VHECQVICAFLFVSLFMIAWSVNIGIDVTGILGDAWWDLL